MTANRSEHRAFRKLKAQRNDRAGVGQTQKTGLCFSRRPSTAAVLMLRARRRRNSLGTQDLIFDHTVRMPNIAAHAGRQNAIDPPAIGRYFGRRDSELEHPTAGKCAAASQRGSRVLIYTRDFRHPTADKAVGFFVARNPCAFVETGQQHGRTD
jgi:hypothetical protein